MYKPSNIQSVNQIELALNEIQPFIEADYTADNIDAVINRAQTLEAYLAQSSKMLADAKYRHSEFLNTTFMQSIREAVRVNMSASITNKYIDSLCRDYKYLVDWCDRVNATITHELDFCRTLISKIKEEMKQLNFGNNY